MRKYIRHMIRVNAEKRGQKPSRAVYEEWNKRQVRKWGATLRAIHVWHGTKPKRKWGNGGFLGAPGYGRY